MSRYKSGSYRDPYLIHADRFSEISSLHEAKLAAWAFAIGEFSPLDDGPARRPHRGVLPDLPAPEPPPLTHRPPLLARLSGLAAGMLASWRLSGASEAAVRAAADASQNITYIDRKTSAGVPARVAGEDDAIRTRAA